jgi:hypothetical protein
VPLCSKPVLHRRSGIQETTERGGGRLPFAAMLPRMARHCVTRGVLRRRPPTREGVRGVYTRPRLLCKASSPSEEGEPPQPQPQPQPEAPAREFTGRAFMRKAGARSAVAGVKALREVVMRRYRGYVKEEAWTLQLETTVEVMRGVLPQVLDGRLIQLYNEGDARVRAEVPPPPVPSPALGFERHRLAKRQSHPCAASGTWHLHVPAQ